MSAKRLREGGCACGAVRYRVRGEPIMVHNCHCRLCQRQTGSTSVVNGFWESDRVEITQGKLVEHGFEAGSGHPHIVRRCADCGSAVFSHYPRLDREGTGIRAGTLDEPGSITPDAVVFTESALPWVTLPEGIPQFAQYYDFREVLPADRVARLLAVSAAAKAKRG